MKIILQDIGKRYGQRWVFKNFSYQFENGGSYTVIGPNGSGKSTLAMLLVGFDAPTCGYIKRQMAVKHVPVENVHRHIAFSAPYLQMTEELRVREALRFALWGPHNKGHIQALLEEARLVKQQHLPVAQLSSGMQQRLKLTIALEKKRSLLLLDEPAAHLDRQGKKWLQKRLEAEKGKRTLIICTPNTKEMSAGEKKICL